MKAGGDSEKSGPRTPRGPEIVLVFALTGGDQLSLGCDEFDSLDAFAAVAPCALIPGHAAAEQVAAQLDLGAVPGGESKPERIKRFLHLAIADDRLHHGPAGCGINRENLVQIAEIDEHSAVSKGRLAPVVPSAAHDDLHPIGARKENGRDDILLVIHANEHLRSAVGNKAVPQVSVEQFAKAGVSGDGDHPLAGFPECIDIHRVLTWDIDTLKQGGHGMGPLPPDLLSASAGQ